MLSNYIGNGTLVLNGLTWGQLSIGFALATALSIAAFYAQRGPAKLRWKAVVFAMRFIALVTVLFILAGPTLRSDEPIPHQSFIAHVVDTSGSMNFSDMDSKTRMEAVQAATGASAARAEIDRLYGPLEFSFDEKVVLREAQRNPKQRKVQPISRNLSAVYRRNFRVCP
jgi:hypothetical protein